MKRIMVFVLLLLLLLLLVGCAGQPYVKSQSLNETTRTKTERICTRKTYVIPWYAVVAAGVFTFKGDEACEDITTTY